MKLISLLWGALVVGIVTFLFLVANEVADREKTLSAIRRDIRKTTEDLQILRAEWSYLNAPARLDGLAADHLGLRPVRPDQYVSLDTLPFQDRGDDTPALPRPAVPAVADDPRGLSLTSATTGAPR